MTYACTFHESRGWVLDPYKYQFAAGHAPPAIAADGALTADASVVSAPLIHELAAYQGVASFPPERTEPVARRGCKKAARSNSLTIEGD